MTTSQQHSRTYHTPQGDTTMFYPVSYEDFLELKEFHRLLLRSWIDHCRWARWVNKSKFRNGPEPIHSEFSTATRHWLLPSMMVPHFATYQTGPTSHLPGVTRNLYFHILMQYQMVRRPIVNPTSLPVLDLPPDWRKYHESLRAFYGVV